MASDPCSCGHAALDHHAVDNDPINGGCFGTGSGFAWSAQPKCACTLTATEVTALHGGGSVPPRPDYCCGACPAVKPHPELHPDCEACRTGYDCTCRYTPGCPNYDPEASDGE